MAPRLALPQDLEELIEHMFEQVLDAAERAELRAWIEEWEAAHPDADAAHRVTGWIDVAYAFQAGADSRQEIRNPVRSAPEPASPVGSSVSFA
ncbi:MAG: hypothetical protein IPO93_06420 [Actinobacteria bacterium]|nr:hypothetical protein [Actinomycetota bacterium]